MPYCVRCFPFSCGDTPGLISINWSSQGSFRTIDSDCTSAEGTSPVGQSIAGEEIIKGPITGNVSIVSYAFSQGEDRWIGSRCQGQAQANQQFMQKYDGKTDEYYLIPTKSHSAQITGDIPSKVASLTQVCETTSVASKLANGATISTKLTTRIGHDFSYNGYPMPIDLPHMGSYSVFGQRCYLSNFNLSVDFPDSPAIVTYGFQFILDCSGGGEHGPSTD